MLHVIPGGCLRREASPMDCVSICETLCECYPDPKATHGVVGDCSVRPSQLFNDAFCRLAHSESTFKSVSFCSLPPISFTSLLTVLYVRFLGNSQMGQCWQRVSLLVSVVASPHFLPSFLERSTRGLVLNTSTAAPRCEFTHHSTSLPAAASQHLTAARLALCGRASASVRSLAMGPPYPRTRAPH